MTAEEVLRLPDDGYRHELARGELRTMSPAGRSHGRIAMRKAWALAQHVEERAGGRVRGGRGDFSIQEIQTRCARPTRRSSDASVAKS
jgi:Uma2 family endonuclease